MRLLSTMDLLCNLSNMDKIGGGGKMDVIVDHSQTLLG